MILLLALILSIIIALLRGGRFKWLATWSWRWGWLAPLAFGLQAVVIYNPLPSTQGLWSWHTLLLIGSYVLPLAVVILNRQLPGMWLLGVGLALNLTVMLANGGFMPVTLEALERAGLSHLALGAEPGARLQATKDILLPQAATRLWLLSDIFVLPRPLPVTSVFSLGDVFLSAGVATFFQRAMFPRASQSR